MRGRLRLPDGKWWSETEGYNKQRTNERVRSEQIQQAVETYGERGRTRTCDPCLKRALLYQLSYAPTFLPI
jgi:hypothetical protein